ncbi:MAG TPA: helix-turn-helix transcriptional regulator [Bacillota bacterium]|nr:helix-turn-helix transcriptional regulator [Bacillota bacterium]HOH09750.1 helix-turn-helix transcriptional regulator [Bacillota bacterium]HOS49918.1 helix-turn-helix transcriptional regulator [Bacillota bacterium]HOY89857.1 helix-turn-helix transcriptional regulator [Bacillota bacterium]HPI00637.1 helix-turn-helix transcriptional regulator [Bacillota bacterium]
MNLPDSIRKARLDRGLTLVEYGGLIGRTKQYMYLLEKGKIKLSYEMAVRLAKALDTTPDRMFSEFIDTK